jgi:hypothetical protein
VIDLSWTAANDTASGIGVIPYKVVFATGATPPADCTGLDIYQGVGTSLRHSGLTANTEYSYRVCAVDDVGNVSTGATDSATTIPADTISVSNNTPITTGSVNEGATGVQMQRFKVDRDYGTAGIGDWTNLNIYISADTTFDGPPTDVLIGNVASWDGTFTEVTIDQGTVGDRTVTFGTSKYIFIVYDLSGTSGGETIGSRVTQIRVVAPDNGIVGLSLDSNLVSVDGTAPSVGTVTPSAEDGTQTYVPGSFTISASLTDAESTVTSCDYCLSTDGTCDDSPGQEWLRPLDVYERKYKSGRHHGPYAKYKGYEYRR